MTNEKRGSASVAVLFLVIAMLGISGAVLLVSTRNKGEQKATVERNHSLYAASSGVSHAVTNLHAAVKGDVGSEENQIEFSGGSYWADVTDNGDGTYTVLSVGTVRRNKSAVEAVIDTSGAGIYNNAIFAGNSSDDPLYELELGGSGGQADEVHGNVYSGQDVVVDGDADVDGVIRAKGDIEGAYGEEGSYQAIPDLAMMNYETTADFDVAANFESATWQWDNAGGWALQLPESDPAHVFRKNPSNRWSEKSSTVKDDYFLEDPYEPVRADWDQDGSDAFRSSFSGISGEPGPNSNKKVFFIDGNLWLHNKQSFSLGIKHNEPNGVQITIVAKGNIYFGDNFFYEDDNKDGLAFIAMKDSEVEDSGNIYFGDPVFGTLQQMHAFMYAENNFYDVNLDASGSSEVYLKGNMTAGNQVLIERDWGSSHTKLTVDFDDRIATGALQMPALPPQSGAEGNSFRVVSWRRVPVP